MKKWLSLLMMFAMASFTWAQDDYDDEYYEDDYEEVDTVKPKAKAKAKPKAKAASSASRLGLQVGLSGDSKMLNAVYDLGSGFEILVGLDAMQYVDAADETVTALGVAAGANYQLGAALLPYGVGTRIEFYNAAMGTNWTDEQMPKQTALNPYFFVKAPLVKNLEASVQAGAYYVMPDGGDNFITLRTTANLTFYFM